MLRIIVGTTLLLISLSASSQGNSTQAPGKQKSQSQQSKQYAPGQEKAQGESAKSYTPGGGHGKDQPMPIKGDMKGSKGKPEKNK